MRIEREPHATTLVLSRRNLLTLLAKLDGNPPDSACTISAPVQYGPFQVKAEEDGVHYFHPERESLGSAGRMHAATEPLVSGLAGASDLGELLVMPDVKIERENLNTRHFECLCSDEERRTGQHVYPCPKS